MSSEKKWNGWGWTSSGFSIEVKYPGLIPSLEEIFQTKLSKNNISLDEENIRIPDSRIVPAVAKQFIKITRKDQFRLDERERLFHSRGRSLPDTIALRTGKIGEFPDAVVYPENEKQILQILKLAGRSGLAVIPYGGGSSVVGGVNSLKAKNQAGIIIMNLSRMNALLELDKISRTARFQCGISGPDLEKKLNHEGYTLGHFPQSFEFSTLGGWIATRGAGYMSDRYGKAEDMVLSLRVCSPEMPFDTEIFQGISEGPLLTQLVAGSEGALGIITEALVKIEPISEIVKFRAFIFREFINACSALRECKQRGLPISMIRISDPEETYYYNKLNSGDTWKDLAQSMALKLMGYGNMSLMLVITEGHDASRIMAKIQSIARTYKGMAVGKNPVDSWFDARYKTPYLRDYLLDFGIASDTFETWITWSKLFALRNEIYRTAGEIERTIKKKVLLMCHISHTYEQGASMYFTILYPVETGNEIKEWTLIKEKFTDVIVRNGGAISHHHGLGTDHKPWLKGKSHSEKLLILRDLKKNLDPENIMNPGKIF